MDIDPSGGVGVEKASAVHVIVITNTARVLGTQSMFTKKSLMIPKYYMSKANDV